MSEASTFPSLSPELKGEIHRIFELQMARQQVTGRTTARERISKLQRLHDTVIRYRLEIEQAISADFGKSPTETTLTEIGPVTTELRHAMRNLRSWMTPRRVGTPLFLFGTRSEVLYESKGVCLIISPWNFPFNLTLGPLVSAIAAGNCVMLKPSEFTPNSSALMKKILAACFPPEEVSMFEGDASVSQELLSLPFHHIFFTGSPAVGKIVMQAASANLASVTLELGGKSPVIVDETADLDTAAAKIIWLKCMNAGQICIATDFVMVQESVHDALVARLVSRIKQFYGDSPEARRQSPDYCRIVSVKHYNRIMGLFAEAVQLGAKVEIGGDGVEAERYIDPAVLTHIPDNAKIWEEEIFGPLLPVRSYKTIEEATDYINARPRPLSMYIFSSSRRNIDRFHADTRAGGGAVNDCGLHFYQTNLPFGGINNSGMGHCHGEAGFLEFSNHRGVTYQNRIFPHTNLFLPPYGRSKLADVLKEGVIKWF